MESAYKRGYSVLGSDVVVRYVDGTANCTRLERRTCVIFALFAIQRCLLGLIRRLRDSSEDPPSPYDPLAVVDKNSVAELNGTSDSAKDFLNGAQKGENETVAQELSPQAIDSQNLDHHEGSSEITGNALPKQDRASWTDTGDRPKHSDNDVANDVRAGSMTNKTTSNAQPIHAQTDPQPPSSDHAVRDPNGISPQLQEVEKHLNTASLLAEDINQTARNALKAEVELIKSMQSMRHEPSSVRKGVL